MTLKEIGAIVLTAIASVGGISGIIIAAIKLSVDIIANRLAEKYTLELNKNFEKFKSDLENKMYISKTKFDTEFGIYRELSRAFFDMVKNVTLMIPNGYTTYPADKDEKEEYERKLYVEATRTTELAQDTLNANAPFIQEEFFGQYDGLLKLILITDQTI